MTKVIGIDRRSVSMNNSTMLEEVFTEYGLRPGSFTQELNTAPSTIGGWMKGRSKPNEKIFLAIEKRGKILSSISLKKNDFDTVCERFGIKKSTIAERLGISRQALHDQQSRGIPDDRLKKIEEIIRELGRDLVKLARRAL